MNFPRPEVFGNYVLKDFGDIVLPADLPWWPIQPGWWLVLALVLLVTGVLAYRRLRRWQRNAYRRRALAQLAAISTLPEMNAVIKAAVQSAFPGDSVASLWGEQWVSFLNSKTPAPCFSKDDGQLFARLLTAPEQHWPHNAEALRGRVRQWLLQHREAMP